MWARVKDNTENDLLALFGDGACMLRPGAIQPMHGIVSKTAWYRGMVGIATRGTDKQLIESVDINDRSERGVK